LQSLTMELRKVSQIHSNANQIALLLLPWIMLQIMDRVSLCPQPVWLLPLHLLLAIGIIIAWKRRFPSWSYTWIGTWYFFLYREINQIVYVYMRPMEHVYYYGINPLVLAILLTIISRRDWLLACLTAYPYTSIIQSLYSLDRNPVPLVVISLLLYVIFFLPLLTNRSHAFKFISLLVGTIFIGIGFHAYTWSELTAFLWYVTILLCIILYPAIIYRIEFLRRLLGVNTVEQVPSERRP
jgi:hypothetical protein